MGSAIRPKGKRVHTDDDDDDDDEERQGALFIFGFEVGYCFQTTQGQTFQGGLLSNSSMTDGTEFRRMMMMNGFGRKVDALACSVDVPTMNQTCTLMGDSEYSWSSGADGRRRGGVSAAICQTLLWCELVPWEEGEAEEKRRLAQKQVVNLGQDCGHMSGLPPCSSGDPVWSTQPPPQGDVRQAIC
ncbi:hypothetical protein DPEC_G00359740 [Dallia pectoralis]|uniref:Uncharacterized protein n=1 Tax=Dallia pectoralis TaxID=75939 RepID=A0ACC2F0R5_DALPE|nr:hypothetical protein DPEC_G00359740 [Dallia pectoralis]